MSRKQPKTQFVGIRMSLVDVQALRAEAGQCGMTMSELICRRITGQTPISRTDQETASRIDWLGRMLKYIYPKDKGWASPEDGSVVHRISLCHPRSLTAWAGSLKSRSRSAANPCSTPSLRRIDRISNADYRSMGAASRPSSRGWSSGRPSHCARRHCSSSGSIMTLNTVF